MLNIEFSPNCDIVTGENRLRTKAYYGNFVYNDLSDESKAKIGDLYNEAQRKYERMHAGNPATRFEKSWTGYLGEEIVKQTLVNHLHYEVIDREVQIDAHGYDGGDILVRFEERNIVINVSSRKLSLNDTVLNVVKNPQNYFILIPVNQLNQYVQRANAAFFVFIAYDRNSIRTVELEGNNIDYYSQGHFIIPGWLNANDLRYMAQSGYLYLKRVGENIRGQYGDMDFNVPMYTDNYVIFSNMLRLFT